MATLGVSKAKEVTSLVSTKRCDLCARENKHGAMLCETCAEAMNRLVSIVDVEASNKYDELLFKQSLDPQA